MTIVLTDGIYIDTLNLSPRIQNQIRSLVAFDNPIFYKNNRLGYSNWNQPMVVYWEVILMTILKFLED